MENEEIKEKKTKKRKRRRRKKKTTIVVQESENKEECKQCTYCNHDHECTHDKECNHDHKCNCKNNHECQKNIKEPKNTVHLHMDKKDLEPGYCKYDFMKLDTLEEKAIFCKSIYEDIIECYSNLNHDKIKETMKVINKYFLYNDSEGNTLLDLELINILKEISNYEVKPIWEKVTAGVGINIHVGLSYKNMVFSLCRDFENC